MKYSWSMIGDQFLKLLFSGPPEFSPWRSWSSCDRTCGGGKRTRTRTCTEYCVNLISSDTEEVGTCNENKCEFKTFNGAFIIFSGPPEFSHWGSWDSCDRTCGGGEKKRTRTCTKYCADLISSDTVQAQAFNENECGPCSSLKSQCDIGNAVYNPSAALTKNIGLCQIDGNTKKVSSIYSFRTLLSIRYVQIY